MRCKQDGMWLYLIFGKFALVATSDGLGGGVGGNETGAGDPSLGGGCGAGLPGRGVERRTSQQTHSGA